MADKDTVYSPLDVIDAAINGSPEDVSNAFDAMVGAKIVDLVQAKRDEVAANMFADEDDYEEGGEMQEDDYESGEEDNSAPEEEDENT